MKIGKKIVKPMKLWRMVASFPLLTNPALVIFYRRSLVQEPSWEDGDQGNGGGVHGQLTVQSLEFHESFCGQSVVQ
jgi:hypothetical protein